MLIERPKVFAYFVNAVLSIEVAEFGVIKAVRFVGMLKTLRDSTVVAYENRLGVVCSVRLEAWIAFVGVRYAEIGIYNDVHLLPVRQKLFLNENTDPRSVL